VVGLVDDRVGVVAEVLERRVDDGVVGAEEAELESPVQVHPVSVEEEREDPPEEVEVHGHDEGYQNHGGSSHELVHPFIGNDGKRARIVKSVVELVNIPEKLETVANVVVAPFEEVRSYPQEKEGKDMVLPGVPARPTECVGHPASAEIEGEGGAERCHDNPLHHEGDLRAHHLRSGVLWVDFIPPGFVGRITIIREENKS